jgi:hypothetical protein
MVAHGLGVSVAPLTKPDSIFSNLRKIPLSVGNDARILGLLTRKDNPNHKVIMKLKQHIIDTVKTRPA